MKIVIRTLNLILMLTAVLSCSDEKKTVSRGFHMGFTPFPYDISLDAVNFTYQKIAEDGDIINHHFDNGVPWPEALEGSAFNDNVINDWNYRKDHTPQSHKIYLSVSALNINRNGLALYRGGQDDMALPSPWDTYEFNDPSVKTAYLNYCKRAIDFFEPDYFNMSVEANLLYVNNPLLWEDYLELHTYVYEKLKSDYPSLPIFSSISCAPLLDGYFTGSDWQDQRLHAQQIIDKSDFFGISFYPYMSELLGAPYPANSFDQLFSLTSKPIVIAETGYPAESFSMDTGNGKVTITSDPEKQAAYLDDLLTHCDHHDVKFVINFVVRDYDQLWTKIGAHEDLTIAWRDTGLYDENGSSRKGLLVWRKFFTRRYQDN
jgi:hypothetical protein